MSGNAIWTSGFAPADVTGPVVQGSRPHLARLGGGADHAAPDRGDARSDGAEKLLAAKMERDRDLVPPERQPAGGTPKTRRRGAVGVVAGDRYRALSDVEHAG